VALRSSALRKVMMRAVTSSSVATVVQSNRIRCPTSPPRAQDFRRLGLEFVDQRRFPRRWMSRKDGHTNERASIRIGLV